MTLTLPMGGRLVLAAMTLAGLACGLPGGTSSSSATALGAHGYASASDFASGGNGGSSFFNPGFPTLAGNGAVGGGASSSAVAAADPESAWLSARSFAPRAMLLR